MPGLKFWKQSSETGQPEQSYSASMSRSRPSQSSFAESDTRTVITPPPHAAMQARDDHLREFFGGGRSPSYNQPPRTSHKHTPRSSTSSSTRTASPRAYAESDSSSIEKGLQALGEDEDYPVLSKHLFKYGFFFPPLWIMGAVTLAIPLKVPPNWQESMTEKEQEELLRRIRKSESKYGKRCLWAFLSLCTGVGLIAVIIWAAVTRH